MRKESTAVSIFFQSVLRPSSKQQDVGYCQNWEVCIPVTIWAVVLGEQFSKCLPLIFWSGKFNPKKSVLQWNTATDIISVMSWCWMQHPWVSGRSVFEFSGFSTVLFFNCKSLISSSEIKIQLSRTHFQVLQLLRSGTWGITPKMIFEFMILSLEVA